jgi:hypothetical protein
MDQCIEYLFCQLLQNAWDEERWTELTLQDQSVEGATQHDKPLFDFNPCFPAQVLAEQ